MRCSIFQLHSFQGLVSCFKITTSESLRADGPKAGFDYLHPNRIWEEVRYKLDRKTRHVLMQKLSESQTNRFKNQMSTFRKQQKGNRK